MTTATANEPGDPEVGARLVELMRHVPTSYPPPPVIDGVSVLMRLDVQEGILQTLLMDVNLPDSRVHPLVAAFDPRIDIGTAVEYAKSFVDLKDCVRRSAGPAEVAPVAARMRSAFYAMYGASAGGA